MRNARMNRFIGVTILVCFGFYVLWLRRAYVDVVWMDQVQWVAGNIRHFYNHAANVDDLYYLTPYNQIFSICWALLNCKLFHYNTYIENIASGVVLCLIALILIRSNLHLFRNRMRYVYIFLVCFMVFGLHKWEASLNGMGLGFYLTFFLLILAANLGHKYYLGAITNHRLNRFFIPLYMLMVAFSIIEYGPYYMAFQISMFLLLLLNYYVFREKLDRKKWSILFVINIVLTIGSFLFNYMLGYFSRAYPFQGYPKSAMPPVLGELAGKLLNDPGFVFRFFLLANTGSLIDPESYSYSSVLKAAMPLAGLLLIVCYGFCIYRYIRRRDLKLLQPASMMIFVLVFYALVTAGRIRFNDLYYGTASRYTVVGFTAVLGLVTVFLYLLTNRTDRVHATGRVLLWLPIVVICFCYFKTDSSQWKIAPYRKDNYQKMALGFKDDRNLELLQANALDIAENARRVMIDNHLNVFRPQTRLGHFTAGSELGAVESAGFYELEGTGANHWRWTNGDARIYLPNLYTDKDSVTALLTCSTPSRFVPVLVLNDSLLPASSFKRGNRYEYHYHLTTEKLLYKATLRSGTYIPFLQDSANHDKRQLGIPFRSLEIND